MGLSYKVEHKSFGFDKEKKKRYVATAMRYDTVSFERVIEQISIRSGINKALCRAVVETMVESMGTWMLEGHGVSLGQIGYLKPAITSKSAEVKGEEKILRKRVLFQPSKAFKQMIEGMSIDKAEEESAGSDSGTGGNGSGTGGTGGSGGEDGGTDFE